MFALWFANIGMFPDALVHTFPLLLEAGTESSLKLRFLHKLQQLEPWQLSNLVKFHNNLQEQWLTAVPFFY